MRTLIRPLAAALTTVVLAGPAVAADSKYAVDQKKVDESVSRGLEYLKKNQNSDGSWSGPGGSNPTTMTGMAGVALLMEGSTCRDGKYADNISKAVTWFLKRAQPTGLLTDPRNPTEGGVYTYGHGYGMLFLACVYGEEEAAEERLKIEKVLKKAVDFSCKAVTKHGGWGYVSAADGGGFDEGSTTVTQLQGLRAARNAGIPVPKETIDNAIKYLRACTAPDGSLCYNYTGPNPQSGGCQAITAAACASACSTGMYKDETFGRWVKYCRNTVYKRFNTNGHDDYSNLYFGQMMYMLGDDRYMAFIDPKETNPDNAMRWSVYKKMAFENYIKSQGADGGWGGSICSAYGTATALILMQQEKSVLPFYQR